MHLKPSHLAHVLVAAIIGSAAAVAGYSAAQPEERRPEERRQAQPDRQQDVAPPAGQDLETGMEAGMQAWAEAMTPGEPHEFLEQFEGEWDTTMRMFWDPDADPQESKGTTTNSMIFGGRFLKQEFKGSLDMPGEDGQMQPVPFEGLGLTGYNNIRKQYVGTWADSMTTAVIYLTGNLSQDEKQLTMFAQMDEPMTGEIGKTVKYVTRIESADRHVFEAWEVLYGEPFKVFEIVYERAGSAEPRD